MTAFRRFAAVDSFKVIYDKLFVSFRGYLCYNLAEYSYQVVQRCRFVGIDAKLKKTNKNRMKIVASCDLLTCHAKHLSLPRRVSCCKVLPKPDGFCLTFIVFEKVRLNYDARAHCIPHSIGVSYFICGFFNPQMRQF